MESGFGVNLEGFLINGNVSLNPGCIPIENGDGSIEAAGSLYINTIKEYTYENGININNVIFKTDYVEIPFNITSNNTTGCLLLNGGITINNTTDSTSLSSGGTFTTLGGMSITKTLNMGGNINMNNGNIINVNWPNNSLDAANKAYVDSKTYGSILNSNFSSGQLLFGGFNNNILGSPMLIYNESSGQLNINASIDVNNNNIHNLSIPILPLDAVNKEYVDDTTTNLYNNLLNIINHITSGNIYGNFSSGQILIGGVDNTITGYETFQYFSTSGILINNTTNGIGVGTGGALTILGGLSVNKKVYIGGGLDVNNNIITNVADPINNLDAVNKEYLEQYVNANIQNNTSIGVDLQNPYIPQCFNYQNSLTLDNNVTQPISIPLLDISATTTLSFTTYIYINSNVEISSLYIIYTIYDGNKWVSNSNYIGNPVNINFEVQTQQLNAIIEYTNANVSGNINIEYYVQENIQVISDSSQFISNLYITSIPSSLLSYNSLDVVAVKINVFISTVNGNSYYLIDLIFKNNIWIINFNRIGGDTGINFFITTNDNIGTLKYTSTQNGTIRIKDYQILSSYTSYILDSNVINNQITYIDLSSGGSLYTCIYIYVYSNAQYALYTLDCFNFNNEVWILNSTFVGDNINISFIINSNGILEYTNPNVESFNIKILTVNPLINCCDNNNGANIYPLEQYSILIGNGNNPIITTPDLTYKNGILTNNGSIYINDTINSSGLTTGSLITLGGACVNKNMYIGGGLDVNKNRITSVADPIYDLDAVNKEYLNSVCQSLITNPYQNQNYNYQNKMTLNNNVTQLMNIPLLNISALSTLSFTTYIYISNINFNALYTIYSLYTGNEWYSSSKYIGNSYNIEFIVSTTDLNANVGYLNYNNSGVTTIEYYVQENIQVNPNTSQLNYTLILTSIPYSLLYYISSDVIAVKLDILISNENGDSCLYIIDLLLKNSIWIINYTRIGMDLGVSFYVNTIDINGNGILQYTSHVSNVIARIKEYQITNTYSSYILLAETNNTSINMINISLYDYAQIYIYAESENQLYYRFYTLECFLFNNKWISNSTFIGDNIKVFFSINENGILEYTNLNILNITVKILYVLPNTQTPLQISNGGTGLSDINVGAILRGDGLNPIIATTDFIYQDSLLQLSNDNSGIIVKNTSDAVGLGSGGNLTLYGGASINKTLYVGNSIYINTINISPSLGDFNEKFTYLLNNVINPMDIPLFIFDSNIVKSFISHISITITLVNNQIDTQLILKGLNTNNQWLLSQDNTFDINVGVYLTISQNGNIQYTSENYSNWISTKIRYRAETTST